MPDAFLPIEPYSLPANYCFTSPQDIINQVAKSRVKLTGSGFSFIIRSTTAPGPADRDKVWLNLNDYRIYNWNAGSSAWVTPHEIPASSDGPTGPGIRLPYNDTPDSLNTYDGGSAGATGDASGPFWEIDTDVSGKTIFGVGTLAPSSTVIALGDTGGVDQVLLTAAQSGLPSHTHPIKSNGADSGTGGEVVTNSAGVVDVGGAIAQLNTSAPASESHTNMPPYKAMYWIKRTRRVYRIAT